MKQIPERPPKALVDAARKARGRARSSYSGFKVGAALETDSGKIYTGCNIENASYGLSLCAERVALVKALSEGARRFRTLVVVTEAKRVTPPCGACRQLLWEYCGNIPVYLSSARGETTRHRLGELLPHPFDRRSL